MKHLLLIALASLLMTSFFSSCNDDSPTNPIDSNKGKLHVKFVNEAGSIYTITGIRLMAMGEVGDTTLPNGIWGNNILTNGKTIAPGEHQFFYLDIPNRHWSKCRLEVDDGSGKNINIDEQFGYDQSFNSTITHWGADDRTVGVFLRMNPSTHIIEIGFWSDWAGIEQ